MINATSTRAVLGLVILCAPAMAIIEPSIDIRLGGAEQVFANTYVVSQRDTVTLAVTAKPGEMIWAFALPLDENLEWTGDFLLTLMFSLDVPTGTLATDIMVPVGAAGSFMICAVAIADDGTVTHSPNLIVHVRPRLANHHRPATGGASMLDE
jgi:hypothetical protein